MGDGIMARTNLFSWRHRQAAKASRRGAAKEALVDVAPARPSAVPHEDRPRLDEDLRDDIKQVIALAIAAAQRERAAAESLYVRGRNTIAFTAALFTAVQAGFLTSVGRESGGDVLLSGAEQVRIALAGAGAAVGLVVAVGVLVFWLDRPREMKLIGAGTLLDAWLNPDDDEAQHAVLATLAGRAIQEEAAWADSNQDRRRAVLAVGISCAVGGLALVAEIVLLFFGLR